MASAKRGLGKGIDGLIVNKLPKTPAAAAEASSQEASAGSPSGPHPHMVDIRRVDRDKSQPRKDFDEEALEELADSIRQYGIVEPLVVEDKGDYYEIIAGERRWRAAQRAELREVPIVVASYTPQEKIKIQIIENLQREDLNPIEEALAFKRLKEESEDKALTDDRVAEIVSKSRAYVTNSMRLLKLDPRVQQMLVERQLTTGHARALISIVDPEKQYEMAQDAFDQKLGVREVEDLVRKLGKTKQPRKSEDLTQYQLQYDEQAKRLAERLGLKVSVGLKEKNKGRLEIEFYSTDDFEKLYGRLSSQD